MYREEIKEFLLEVCHKEIRQPEWPEEYYFVPNGTWKYDAMQSMVMMEGVMYQPETGKYYQDLPVLDGHKTYDYVNHAPQPPDLHFTPQGVTVTQPDTPTFTFPTKSKMAAAYESGVVPPKSPILIAEDKGAQCNKCGGHNVRQTESGFQFTRTIMWCDDCKDEA